MDLSSAFSHAHASDASVTGDPRAKEIDSNPSQKNDAGNYTIQPVFLLRDGNGSLFQVDEYIEKFLEGKGVLNWCKSDLCPNLRPLLTTGDGNCLLHAVSLCLYGHEDFPPILRQNLSDYFQEPEASEIQRRWKYQRIIENHESKIAPLSNEYWENEWDNIYKMAKCTKVMQQLENIHIFVLAHYIRRPIIVIADKMLYSVIDGSELAEIGMAGIYLPLGLEVDFCDRNPVVIAYHASHFSAACFDKSSLFPVQIALTYSNKMFLPIKFGIDPGINFEWDKFQHQSDVHFMDRILTFHQHIGLLDKYVDLQDATAFDGPELTAQILRVEYEENAGNFEL